MYVCMYVCMSGIHTHTHPTAAIFYIGDQAFRPPFLHLKKTTYSFSPAIIPTYLPTYLPTGENSGCRRTNSGSKLGRSSLDDNEEIAFKELQLMEIVGSGHSGSLWRAKWKEMLVAVKMIKVRKEGRKLMHDDDDDDDYDDDGVMT